MEELDEYIDIPTYYKRFVDDSVDLNITKNIPCKFHGEVNGKSFTYSPEKKVFRCWGACRCGGKGVQLHRLNFHLHSDKEAEESLCKILGLQVDKTVTLVRPKVHDPNMEAVELNSLIAKCERRAKTPEQWVELDYVMSQYPVDKEKLELFLEETK